MLVQKYSSYNSRTIRYLGTIFRIYLLLCTRYTKKIVLVWLQPHTPSPSRAGARARTEAEPGRGAPAFWMSMASPMRRKLEYPKGTMLVQVSSI